MCSDRSVGKTGLHHKPRAGRKRRRRLTSSRGAIGGTETSALRPSSSFFSTSLGVPLYAGGRQSCRADSIRSHESLQGGEQRATPAFQVEGHAGIDRTSGMTHLYSEFEFRP
jgi:hypothetical protein